MDEQVKIWNLLHDGVITAVQHNGETLTIVVDIPYLRCRMKPVGDSFILQFTGLTCLEYQDYDGMVSCLAKEVENAMPVILSTDSEAMPVKVNLTTGQLILDFKGISITLENRESVAFETIDRLAREYWHEFEKRAQQARC